HWKAPDQPDGHLDKLALSRYVPILFGMTSDRPLPARDWPIPPMDKEPGDKLSAFTWAMGRLILQRIADGETIKAITAHPKMPAYCTVYRWIHVHEEFGDA